MSTTSNKNRPQDRENGEGATSEHGHKGSWEEQLTPEALAEIWAKRALKYAAPPPAEETGETLKLLAFNINGERYGIEVNYVREIYSRQQITPVPRTPDFLVGLFSARGRIVSIIDLHAFLGLPSLKITDDTKIVVVADGASGMEVGLVADEVEDIIILFTKDVEPMLTTHINSWADFTLGIAPGMLIVLNLQALLSDKHLVIHEELD